MSDRKSGADNFVDKLASLYVRMREEKGDDATTSTIYESVRKALGKLGIKLSQEAMEARTKRIARAAIKKARDELRKQYLIDIDIAAGGGSYALSFFPDVKIPNTPENAERWRSFMGSLAAKTRIGPDPRTGSVGILFRDGVWLGDLVLATDMKSFHIIEDVHTVAGDLVAANARVVNNRFTHELTVEGDLHCNRDLLRQDPPPIAVRGGITLLGERSVTEAIHPEMLIRWGMADGDRLTLRNETYILRAVDAGGYTEYILEGENVATNHEWMTEKWRTFKVARIDPALLDEVHAKLVRVCLGLGLGQSFVSPGEKKAESNIDRIATYLEFCLSGRAAAGCDPMDAGQENAVHGVLLWLDRLWVMLRGTPDKEAVLDHLAIDLDRDLDEVAAYACKGRVKLGRKEADHDMELLARLGENPVDVNDMLENGVATARFLMDTFKSDDSRQRLLHVLKEMAEPYARLTGLAEGETPDLRPLLAEPGKVMDKLLTGSGQGDDAAVEKLGQELRTLRKTRPKELIRKIVNVPIASEEPAFQQDAALLRDLFAMRDASLESLGFDAERTMDLLHPAFQSVFAERIAAVRAVWKGGEPESPRVKDLAGELAGMDPPAMVQALRKSLRDVQAAIRKYNALTSSAQSCPLPDAGEEEAEAAKAPEPLPAHLVYAIQGRLNRLCLSLGLGKQFLEQHSGALAGNIDKLDGLLALCESQPEPDGGPPDPGHVRVVTEVRDILDVLRGAVSGGGDLGRAELEAERLSDHLLSDLGEVVQEPRAPVDLTGMQADARTLKALLDPDLTVERVFTSAPRLLLYLNSALESKEMKIAVSKHIKPVYFALTALQKLKPDYKGLSLNDLLRAPDRAAATLADTVENRDEPEARREARKILDALRTIGSKSVRDTLKMLRNTQQKGGSEALEGDLDLLDSLLAFERGALGSLKLDPKRTGLLLLLSLESFIVNDLKAHFESGAISSKNSRQIIQTLHDKLQSRLTLARTFNKLIPETVR